MNILFIGDIFGSVGRDMVQTYLPKLKKKYSIDFVIMNAENAAHGKGISQRVYEELVFAGGDVLTMGNHAFAKKELMMFIDEAPQLIIPANIQKSLPGKRSTLFHCKNKSIRVTNLLGIINMFPGYAHPFETMKAIIDQDDADIHIVDFHAEATSEKVAFGYDMDGKVTAVLGTHTHIQTADEKILSNGTAYISDVGMSGPYDSVIGCEKHSIINRMKTGLMQKFEPAQGEGQLCAVVLMINDKTNKVDAIKRIMINPDHPFID